MNKLILDSIKFEYLDFNLARKIFTNVSAEFSEGNTYAIMGRSGSGKTTLLKLISGELKSLSGVISYKDEPVIFGSNTVSVVYQDYNLIDYMSPIENIIIAMDIAKLRPKRRKAFVEYILGKVGISKVIARKKVKYLSGGEKQRVAIARALCLDSPIIIADEPTGNLDKKNEDAIMNLIHEVCSEYKKILIIVTHSEEVAKTCSHVYRIDNLELKVG